jgi:hypothetical protein
MAIHTSMFGPLILTGEDAKAFLQQIRNPVVNEAARASIARGIEMSDEYDRNGFVVVKLRPSKPARIQSRKKAR